MESKAVENLDTHPDNVLEVGFGSGVGLTNELKKLEQNSGQVYLTDISEQVVSCQVREHLSKIGGANSCQLRTVTPPQRKNGVLYEAIILKPLLT